MNLLSAVTIVIAWYSFLNNPPQTPIALERQSTLGMEKRAVSETQRILAYELDNELPRVPFANWFRQIIGPEPGLVWQLTECGEIPATPNSTWDIRACVEANTILSNERRVIVMITVGTFKRGIVGAPAFYIGVIEHEEELYTIKRLRDLPKLLSAPGSLANRPADKLPDVVMPKVRLTTNYALIGMSWPWSDGDRGQSIAIEAPLPPAPPAAPPQQKSTPNREPPETPTEGLKILGSVTWGGVIKRRSRDTRRAPRDTTYQGLSMYKSPSPKRGVSPRPRLLSGHPLLRGAAEDAARQWVFKPSTLNGVPVETQIVLTFVFKVPEK